MFIKFHEDKKVKGEVKFKAGEVYEFKNKASAERWLRRGCEEVKPEAKPKKPVIKPKTQLDEPKEKLDEPKEKLDEPKEKKNTKKK